MTNKRDIVTGGEASGVSGLYADNRLRGMGCLLWRGGYLAASTRALIATAPRVGQACWVIGRVLRAQLDAVSLP